MIDTIHNEDCLVGMQRIPDQSVDMILCDLPYGHFEFHWDNMIPLDDLWAAYRRVLKQTGIIVLTARQPFTSRLILSNLEMFKYSLVWRKSVSANYAQAKRRPLSEHEDILVFSRGGMAHNAKIQATYNPQGVRAAQIHYAARPRNSMRPGRRPDPPFVQTQTGYPKSVIAFPNEVGLHPTQKPVPLFEYLIRTYTNPGEVVLDNCMGSGTTAIAAINAGRHYLGFEKDLTYFEAAQKRIAAHRAQLSLLEQTA